jgi:hypothetical protein
MRSHRSILSAITLTLTTALALGSPAIAADLPQSGSFKLHSGWKSVGEVVQVGDNHVFGTGNFWGVTFNDAGSGSLDKGAVVCPYTLELMNGSGPVQGSCAWGENSGDEIFSSYTGKIAASGALDGVIKITGGTGKFKGIQGQGAFQCITLNDKGQYSCAQQFDYSLTTVANK